LPSYLTRKLFSHVMGIYENKYIVNNDVIKDVSLISGCYMLCRRDILVKVGLFNEKYFLYFEDFSLSIELNKFGKLIYHPCVNIVHFGGNTFSKGARHIFYFIRSAIRFFNEYGWKIF
jgi:GT2 family glycosyltransferase